MFKDTGIISNAAIQYVLDKSLRETNVQRELREATFSKFPGQSGMMGAPEEAQFLSMIIKMMGARRMIEVGVFTGYTTLSFALAATDNATRKDGVKIVALDVSEEYTALGKEHWKRGHVDDVIDLRLAPGMDSLGAMLDESSELNSYDLAFIDGDKENYINYYEALLKLIRPGGLIVIDNTLWGGKVFDATIKDEGDKSTEAIRALNNLIKDDKRVDLAMLTIADGVTICRKM